MPNNVRSAQAAKSQQGRDVKSTWKTIARGGGGGTTFPVGESRRVSNQMRFVCRILDAGDLHVYMCYIHGSTFWGWLKDCLQLIQRIRLSKNIIDSQGICQIRLFQAQKLAGQEKCKLNGKKETFQTGLSLHSITRKAALI